ncbi:MAG: aminoacyl-tRNA hydrolase [Bacteroidota bacterium]
MKYLVVGLGNIGSEYELTRHNIGFLVLDRLADQKGAKFEPARYGDQAIIKHKGRTIHLIKPSTYMNLSGKAVNYWLNALKLPREELLVVVDDIALPFGKLRMRIKGSDAGHNGMKSIEQLTGGNNYPRLRFGLGNDFHKGQQVDYVLSRFTQDEFDALPEKMDKAIDMILSFCTIGINRTMNQYNE